MIITGNDFSLDDIITLMLFSRRNRASRIQRGHDISSELTMLPTTPPPSYSSFKFDSPIENNQSTSSVKNSTDASEDEGSFTIGLTKSPPAHTRNSDEITNLHDDTGLNEPSNAGGKNGKIFQINGEGIHVDHFVISSWFIIILP